MVSWQRFFVLIYRFYKIKTLCISSTVGVFLFLFCLHNSDIIALLRPSESPTWIKTKNKNISSLWRTSILFFSFYIYSIVYIYVYNIHSTTRNSRINLLISWSDPFLYRWRPRRFMRLCVFPVCCCSADYSRIIYRYLVIFNANTVF